MRGDPAWQADLERYPPKPFLKEQSIYAVWLYRLGRRIDGRREGPSKWVALKVYWFLFRLIETAVGISLPKSAQIGPGLRIWHFGNIFVHPGVVIGVNCTLRQGVTIGNRYPGGPVPHIGDNCEFGAYAQVLGGIRVGNDCRIGALSVVLDDIPDGATAIGTPARVIAREESRSLST
jgi:serine O-acetyltransferase